MFYSVHKFSGLENAIKSDPEFWQRLNLYTGESGGGPCGVVYDFLSLSMEQIWQIWNVLSLFVVPSSWTHLVTHWHTNGTLRDYAVS
jgi:hypothetical protein